MKSDYQELSDAIAMEAGFKCFWGASYRKFHGDTKLAKITSTLPWPLTQRAAYLRNAARSRATGDVGKGKVIVR